MRSERSGWLDSNQRSPVPGTGVLPLDDTPMVWVGMAGIEPASSCSPNRRPTTGLHPDRRSASSAPRAAHGNRWAPRAVQSRDSVVRERRPASAGRGRPGRDRTSDSPLRTRVLFPLSYRPDRARRHHEGGLSRSPAACSHARCFPLHLVEGTTRWSRVFFEREGASRRRRGYTSPAARRCQSAPSRVHVSCGAKVPVGVPRGYTSPVARRCQSAPSRVHVSSGARRGFDLVAHLPRSCEHASWSLASEGVPNRDLPGGSRVEIIEMDTPLAMNEGSGYTPPGAPFQ